MGLMSIKDYAERSKVSYEAVRHQVARYKEELGAHIIKDGRQNFLDDFAVAFLDERRAKNPVIIYQASKDEEIERLKEENNLLLKKIAAQSDEITQLNKWKADKAVEIAAAEQSKLLLETTQNNLDEAKQKLIIQKAELEGTENRLKEEEEARRAAEEALAEYKAQPWYKRIFAKKSS